MVKKKLVMQNMSGERIIDHSMRYFHKRAYWLAEVILVSAQGYRDAFEFEPDGKITLKEMLEISKSKMMKLGDENTDDFGVRVYQLTRSR